MADRTGGVLRLYVNGTSIAPGPLAIVGNPDVSEPGTSVGIGTIVNGLGAYYDGMMDDIRIYNRVLSQAEIQTLMSFTGPPTAATNLMATAPPYDEVDLTWTAGTQVATYNVERSPQGQNTWTNLTPSGLPSSTTSYIDLSALAGKSYDYRIISVNPIGTATSAPVTITAPARPRNASSESGNPCGCGLADASASTAFAVAGILALGLLLSRRGT